MRGEKSALLFRRYMEPRCDYCKYGISLGYGEVACSKRGIMSDEGKCGAFFYEPTKRKPEYARKPPVVKIAEEDLSI